MLTFASEAHRQHHPRQPFHDRGRMIPPPEIPERVERIRTAITAAGLGAITEPGEHGIEPVLRVHTAPYVEFLQHVHAAWRAATDSPVDAEAFPYARAIRDQPFGSPDHPIAQLGWYSHDNDAVLAGTWAAAIGAVDVTLGALDAVVVGGERAAYALARPPGHHAAADSYAGYCFLNNAAIAAQAWVDRGARVAILDVDYHHGNGTQQLFYDRGDVLFVSLHADPAYEYPFFLGYTAERGTGAGAGAGATRNFPLPLGTAWDAYGPTLDAATAVIAEFAPDGLVVSLGVDTAAEDPDTFQLVADDFTRIGAAIGALRLPTLLVQEGGYDLAVLGRNVVNVLRGVEGA